ncbi:MAG: hypothetical protein NTU53_03855 [Planctomycetota bacterium]|nr:hypothetical protein [Planctomycetota bacterium]
MTTTTDNLFALCDRNLRTLAPDRYLLSATIELALIAILFTLILFLFMRYFGLCSLLRQTRRQMLAQVYQLLVYRRCLRLLIRSELNLILANLKYLLILIPTLLFGSLLFAAIYNALLDRYGRAPLPINQDFVIRTRPSTITSTDGRNLLISARVRSASTNTVWTRLRAPTPGVFPLQLGPDRLHLASINIQTPSRPTRPWQYTNGLEIHIPYPTARWFGLPHGHLLYFLLICLLASPPIARLTGVKL